MPKTCKDAMAEEGATAANGLDGGSETDRIIMGVPLTDGQTTLTNIRKISAPYLPPPLLKVVHVTDNYFRLNHASITKDYCYDEPSMAIISALFLAYIVWWSIQGVWASTTKRSTAHLTGGEDTVLGKLLATPAGNNKQGGSTTPGEYTPPPFRETVVFCGASNSGKTALLHSLCKDKENASDDAPPMTVTSLVANVGYICSSSDNANADNNTIRIIDYPGHPSLSSQLTTLLLPTTTSRLVFTLDATQPVTVGAALLYQSILTNYQVRQSWKKQGKTLVVLVVCTKSDAKGAKNYKRMKIQLRNELDRLCKVDLAIEESGGGVANGDEGGVNGNSMKASLKVTGKTIDMDNLGPDVPVSLHFVEAGTYSGKGGLDAIREFVLSGILPSVK